MKYIGAYFLIVICVHSINCMESLSGLKDIDPVQLRKDVKKYTQENNEKIKILMCPETEYTGSKSLYDSQLKRAYREGNGERIEQLVQTNPRLLPLLKHVIQDNEKRVTWSKDLVQYIGQQQTDEQRKKVTARIKHGQERQNRPQAKL